MSTFVPSAGEPMSVKQAWDPGAPLQRLRMSWEEYLRLPEKPKAEFVDGEVVVTPPVSFPHGIATAALGQALRSGLPELYVAGEIGLQLPRNRLRAPDLMVVERRPTGTWVTESPVLVIEVLSPSTRLEDLVRKSAEYAEGGCGQYWVVDPEARVIEVLDNVDGTWETVLRLDDHATTGEVRVSRHGTVALDLDEIVPI